MASFSDSQFRFTSPIRFFKANDPIYYEVDNIPLKQLQENDLWLKDQIRNLKFDADSISRVEFSELKPYVEGVDNKVYVRPGRFTARINDAYNITPLQVLKNILGSEVTDINQWLAGSGKHPSLSTLIDEFKKTIGANYLGLNGLIERAFSRISGNVDRASQYVPSGSLTIDGIPFNAGGNAVRQYNNQPPYPGLGAILWTQFEDSQSGLGLSRPVGSVSYPQFSYSLTQYEDDQTNQLPINIGFASLNAAESAFIKRWRGVARTAVVDVPNELSIDIPAFNEQDHFYVDSNGAKQLIPATQRIDLLFVYSKPVDAENTTISKFVNNTPTTITKAELGLFHGAGLGVDYRPRIGKTVDVITPEGASDNTPGSLTNEYKSTEIDGTPRMLSHLGDETGTNNGFQISSGFFVKGSFPSPDDLMNLSPLLDEELNAGNFNLIGQTILPLAYIVVRKNAQVNENSSPIINVEDLIDIRPFFRTTELSYNERAGIAAAIPAPSLANPIVTQAELSSEMRKIYTSILGTTGNSGGSPLPDGAPTSPRVVYSQKIMGGWAFGVEGALLSYVMKKNPSLSRSEAVELVKTNYNYSRLPQYPDWDRATWCHAPGSFPNTASYPNDFINYHSFKIGSLGTKDANNLPTYKYAAYATRNLSESERLKRFGTQAIMQTNGAFINSTMAQNTDGEQAIDGLVNFLYVRKKCRIVRTGVPWMGDYDVNVQFLNCVPLTCHTTGKGFGGDDRYTEGMAGIAGLWVEKYRDYFYIYAAWVAKDYRGHREPDAAGNIPVRPMIPPLNREGNHFAGFAVINKDFMKANAEHHQHNPRGQIGQSNIWSEPEVGIAIYPTIQFEVVGIPNTYLEQMRNSELNNFNYGSDTTLVLR